MFPSLRLETAANPSSVVMELFSSESNAVNIASVRSSAEAISDWRCCCTRK